MNNSIFGRFRVFISILLVSVMAAAFVLPASAQLRRVASGKKSVVAANRVAVDPKRPEAPPPVQPQYQIYDIGVVQMGDGFSQAFGISPGGVAVGRSIASTTAAGFTWTQGSGIVGLPNLSGRSFCVSNSANDSAGVVGTCSTTLFGSSRLPVIWQNGVVSQLPLPSGETLGDANHVNASGVAVGSINAGISQRGVIYSGGTATPITQQTTGGSYFLTAFGINDSGRIVGQGIDSNNAARNVGIVYDIGSLNAFEVPALSGDNGALAFGVSNTGYVVGASMFNQGSGRPFFWSVGTGTVEIPLAAGTSQGSARAVNSAGWVVGTDSSAFAIPWVWTGNATYRLQDLIPANSGWDLSTNTSSSAMGISDGNVIVGTGVFNGLTHAYAMVPIVNVSVSGRILTSGGAGIRNCLVTASGGDLGSPVVVQTGSFGYFLFTGLHAGQTYTISVSSKRFAFAQASRNVTPAADVTGFDFTADPF